MATYLQRTPSTLGDRTKWTISMWYKRTSLSNFYLTSCNNSSNYSTFYVTGDGHLRYYNYWSGAIQHELKTNRLFRDTNAWYHIVMAWDSTLATANDRFKFYVNGVQETSFATRTNSPQNEGSFFNVAGYNHRVGAEDTTSGGEGLLSHVHFTDGYVYDASAFGETDSTTGEWKIKTSPSVTYGTNGFFILKDGNSVTDQSGNGNNFTVAGGTLTKTEDSPSNVFANFNGVLQQWEGDMVVSNGNTTAVNNHVAGNMGTVITSLGATSGKYYFEMKQANSNGIFVGVCGENFVSDNLLNAYSGQTQNATTGLLQRLSDGTRVVNGTSSSNIFTSTSSGDIVGIAIDLDASTRTVTFYKNGVVDSAGSQNLPTNMQTGYVFGVGMVFSSSQIDLNAGNGYFGTTAVSSAGTNASGIGIFEYDVPTGYTALSTKGLNL